MIKKRENFWNQTNAYKFQEVSKTFLTEKDEYPNGPPSQWVRLSSMQILKKLNIKKPVG